MNKLERKENNNNNNNDAMINYFRSRLLEGASCEHTIKMRNGE